MVVSPPCPTLSGSPSLGGYSLQHIHKELQNSKAICAVYACSSYNLLNRITVKSRGWEPGLFIDGWYHCKFPEGTVAKFEMRLNDALRTVELI